jgi:hypothetical protein
MHQNQRHTHHHPHHKKPKKKKLSLFYKATISFLLTAFIALFYFVVLVSTEPKSISFVTQKIEEVLQEKFGENNVALEETYLSFTRYGTLKIAVTSLKILYKPDNNSEKQAFILPKLEAEFSLLNFLLLHFQPKKIKIINPNIVIDDLQKLQVDSQKKTGDLSVMIALLSSIRKGDNPIENFEIENAKFLIRGQEFNTEVLLKKSQIHATIKDKILNISSENQISFDETKVDVSLGSNCKLSENDGLKCDLFLENFVPDSISALHPSLNHLSKIAASFDGSFSFSVKNSEFSNVAFKLKTEKGDFEFLDFFGQKIDFSNFSAAGEYNHKLKILNLSAIETDFSSDQKAVIKPHLAMSLLISNLSDPQQKLDFYIKLQNVLNDELEKFWPTALHENGVREWVIKHMKGGMIREANAKFSLLHDEAGSRLSDINSEVKFSDFELEYGAEFPVIKNLSGVANFTQKSMKISISAGDVLQSKISEGLVAIDDFSAPITMLKISGKSVGHAADTLQHANHTSEFYTEIQKYLNGNSQNDFDIRIPLHGEINLKNIYIAANSAIAGLDNPYVKGGVIINSKKDFGKTSFVTNVDLTAAELIGKAIDVEKKSGVESGLDLIVVVNNPQKIFLKNILLWKKEETNKKISLSKISGDIAFETAPFLLTSVDFKNNNFGKNNYEFSYDADTKTSSQKILVKGQQFNFGSLIEGKFFKNFSGGGGFSNFQIQATINNTHLLHHKSLKNFYLSLNCKNDFCFKGLVKGSYGKNQSINLNVGKKPQSEFVTVDGRITDVGHLAEALGISNVVSAGDAKVKLQNKIIDKKPVLSGEITIDSNITIYESPTVKRLASNTLFSAIKDKIFSSEKTIFDSVKLEFDFQNSILNIKSLIANNYKIGITAKGAINLKDDTYELKGMIIPGFLINNLFGIGKIPLIGGVISGLLTGGEGGGLFGIHYTYIKNKGDKEAVFETNKVAAFVPTTIQNLFD